MQDLDKVRKAASPLPYSISKYRTEKKRRNDQRRGGSQRDEQRSARGLAVREQRNGMMT